MYSILALVAFFATTALSAPTPTAAASEPYGYTPNLAEYYSLVDRHIAEARRQEGFPNAPVCNLAQASLPTAPTPLPSPDVGTSLLHVGLGFGTQNYTCANNSATPAAIGATATLYNVSCVAALYPDILTLLPNLTIQYPLPTDPNSPLAPASFDISGKHFFSDTTTPVFNLDQTPQNQFGLAVSKKNESSNAPVGAPLGPNNEGHGAVAWLFLKTIGGTTNNIKNVYRTNTAGGSPPTTCARMPASFEVTYSALYWFWNIPS